MSSRSSHRRDASHSTRSSISSSSEASPTSSSRSHRRNTSSSSNDSRSTAPSTPRSVKIPALVRNAPGEDRPQHLQFRQPVTQVTPLRQRDPEPKYAPPSPSSSASSINTYDSSLSELEEGAEVFDDDDADDQGQGPSSSQRLRLASRSDDAIPSALPPYRCATLAEPSLRPTTPQNFSRLFPSMDRLTIRHDDLTPDGNMNLRVDTLVNGSRRPIAFQLFHLRMHDLARRDFSLRRYCRQSGREVCNSKRAYTEPSPVSSVIRSVRRPLQRSTSTASSLFRRRHNAYSASSSAATSASSCDTDHAIGAALHRMGRRPSVSTSGSGSGPAVSAPEPKFSSAVAPLVPTNTIKLEFSNYARVDIARHGSRGYDFSWWGHRYTWRRDFDKALGVSSFHLVRDGNGAAPVAHIVPEVRSPTQLEADEDAGGWIPPCYMWISDQSIIDAITDVADVIVATGLITLVDHYIRERWSAKKPATRAARALSFHAPTEADMSRPRALMNSFFNRRHSEQHTSSPLRWGRAVTAH